MMNANSNSRSCASLKTFASVAAAAAKSASAVSADPEEWHNHESRKNAWIKKRWKAAFHTVTAIGSWTKLDPSKNGSRSDPSDASNEENVIIKKKWHLLANYNQSQSQTICAVCDDGLETEDEDEQFMKCQYCPILVHRACVNSLSIFCQAQKPKFVLRNQKSTTPSDDLNNGRIRASTSQLDEQDDDDYGQNSNPQVIVDPIYLALKEANRMASSRRLSVTSSPSPVGPNACSPRDLTPSDSMRELTVNRLSWCKMPSSASATSYGSSSGYGSSSSAANGGGSSKSLRNSPARMQYVSSTPSLIAQKSTESQDSGEFKRPTPGMAIAATPSAVVSKPNTQQRRPPKLDSKMKSLSLDCPDAKGRSSKAIPQTSGYSPVGRRVLKVRPCKNSSFDASDDGADPSSGACSPCPSPYCGSMSMLPSNAYAVTHDYHTKFPEEIALNVGERVFVFDTGDPDWWQGQNMTGLIGIFPAHCAAHIHANERVMQVVQNLNLWDGSKSLRLYRDQIVFAQQADPDGLVEIRTEHDRRINCPIQYLMCLD